MSGTISLEEIISELDDLEGQERLQYLMELGDTLPAFPVEWQTEPNRVLGCMSQVWLVPRVQADPKELGFEGTSDAALVRGLMAFVLAVYNGHTPQEILAYPIDETIERAGLGKLIGMQRSSGLRSMIRRIRDLAELAEASPGGIIAAPTAIQIPAPPTKPIVVPSSHASRLASPLTTVDSTALLDVEKIRAQFPILQRQLDQGKPLIYLDNGASTQRPLVVLAAMREIEETGYSNVHRGGHTLAAESTARFEEARTAIQQLLNAASRNEIIFTSGTTAGVNLVAQSYGGSQLQAGDEILLTEMEHHSNIVPWQQIAERTGAIIRWAPITDDYLLDLDAFNQLLTSRTKIVAITAISNVLGTINPLRELISKAHAMGAVVLVDAAQAAPHEPLDVQALDCDFLVFSGHKMLGPTGIGVLYGKEALLAQMPPFLGGGSMINTVTREGFTPALLPHKFEAGTPPIVQAIGLGAAVKYLQEIGLANIMRHERQLTRRAHELLSAIPGLRILGPDPEQKSGIVTFVMNGVHPDDLSRLLDVQGIAVRAGHHCAMPLHARLGVSASCRASFYLYNSLAEVEQLAAELAQIQQRFAR
ncbi:putative cysteine desulfurase [Anatilimnocola aggregata]|uniref:cysteine desulfurase n=1 Tax=Anatilimnocola aggregata TaxID=2528021 RepID=A0A517Y735_9BACT|nr:SufS family cysteine desulfurase [Anatilimnocola aggregata]QDU26044.1 putative cysteine desulfurase [Anatilimnocola aggregata]